MPVEVIVLRIVWSKLQEKPHLQAQGRDNLIQTMRAAKSYLGAQMGPNRRVKAEMQHQY